MVDVIEMIRRDVSEDGLLKIHGFTVELAKKGLLPRKQTLRVSGTVERDLDRRKLEQIVTHHVGDTYSVDFDVRVAEGAGA
jgi:hypothetical protein